MQEPTEPRFPFTAIVGQTPMKRALLLNAINTKIGGVLIRGKKGTAKSTAVRSLAALLPEVRVIQGCPYSCPPEARQDLCQWCEGGESSSVSRQVRIVDLPVGATEDRLVGSLDIELAIKTGTRSFEPGLIAATHRGILYIDEVNLLSDHLVDVLLDAAAMGRNYVEREGISISHAADFILVGTMNPEEGDLRPQLLDRFGLAVEVEGTMAAEDRREVVRRRISYEADPFQFMSQWQEAEQEERERLLRSQQILSQVTVGDDILELITDICAAYEVDGLRGDIVMYKTASTIAAYEGRTRVSVEDVREAAQMALLHRQRRQPFQQPQLLTEQLDSLIDDYQSPARQREPENQTQSPADQGGDDSDPSDLALEDPGLEEPPPEEENNGAATGAQDQQFEVGTPFSLRSLPVQPPDQRVRRASGRRARTVSSSSDGRYVGAKAPQGKARDLALDATMRAAAPYQKRRQAERSAVQKSPLNPPLQKEGTNFSPFAKGDTGGFEPSDELNTEPAVLIERWDVREKVRETKTGALILFVVDASGSMGAQRRMVAVKGAILSLLLDAYQRRDRVGMISFRGTGAELLLPPTGSVDLAQLHLREMPTGGRTPLSRGLNLALEVVEIERMKDKQVLPLLVLLTDGRANVRSGATGVEAEAPGQAAPGEGDTARAEAKSIAEFVREQQIPALVIDTELDFIKLGLALPIADAMGGHYIKLDDLHGDNLAQAVRLQIPSALPSGRPPDDSTA